MRKFDDFDLLRSFAWQYKKLQRIAEALHNQDEDACNYGLTIRQKNWIAKYEKEAEEIAQKFGLHAYHQEDPRGCNLYLVEKVDADTNYTDGIAII